MTKEATKEEVEKFISGAKKYRKSKEEKPSKQPKTKLTFGIPEPYDPFGLCLKPDDAGFGEPLSIKIIRDAEGNPIIKHVEKQHA